MRINFIRRLLATVAIMSIATVAYGQHNDGDSVRSLLEEYPNNKTTMDAKCGHAVQYSDVYYVCLYLRFQREGNVAEFLSGIPVASKNLAGLWQVDEDIFKSNNSDISIPILKGGGFVDVFSNAIYAEMLHDNPVAYEKYIALYRASDGYFSEDLEDKLEKLLKDYPVIVLRDWPYLRDSITATTLETTDIASDIHEMIKKYRSICSNTTDQRATCKEVIKYFEKIKESSADGGP